jgi:hypothetical protein
MKTLDMCVLRNKGKALIGLIVFAVCETLLTSVLGAPALLLVTSDTISASDIVLAAVLIFAALTCVFILAYGFIIFNMRFVRRQFVSIGFIFIGFREYKRIIPAALLFSLCAVISLVLTEFGLYLLRNQFQALIKEHGLSAGVGIIGGSALLLFILLSLKFSFVWPIMWDMPFIHAGSAFLLSAKILKGQVTHLVKFVIKAGGKSLIIAVSFFLFSVLIPPNSSGGFVFFILDFIYFVNLYTALIRMLIAFPVFFDAYVQDLKKSDSHILELGAPDSTTDTTTTDDEEKPDDSDT